MSYCVIALGFGDAEATERIGATRVVPGSNYLPADPTYGQVYERIPLQMPAGSIRIIGACYHGGDANKTHRDRPAVAMNYCSGFKYGCMAGCIHCTDPHTETERR